MKGIFLSVLALEFMLPDFVQLFTVEGRLKGVVLAADV